ncbi:ATP-binding protein [Peptoniphilus equinus]|uniref:histidine kinase n=1 Tax=Peptoniphilus equinus TaxID=3016343 RepID=A0ABY7QUM3_9FIRM|nr:ATP-binding protein [Peptoniphilus equinus]WBW50056.1 ATP-binding protein [Peptoniphilus equinus]
MFSSIKYRFITLYLILMLLCMAIVGTFIINRLESVQVDNATENMHATMNSIISTSNYLNTDNWLENNDKIIDTFVSWRLMPSQVLYAITSDKGDPLIIAASRNSNNPVALSNDALEPDMVLQALAGNEEERTVHAGTEDVHEKHIAKPVFAPGGQVMGVLYMTESLTAIYNVVDNARVILTYATGIAVFITAILGYFLANSITTPIRAVTKKARKMANGDFHQHVDVKSNDEIGKLGSMFNLLTEKLNATIADMELERGKLDSIFTYMQEGLVAVDRNGTLVHVNPTAKRILKKPDAAELDLSPLPLNKVDYNDFTTLVGEEELLLKGKYYKIKYGPFRRERSIQGLIVVFQDVTREHNLDALRKEFVANVSHELKTPITTVQTYSETLLDSDLLEGPQKHFIATINHEAQRMGQLVTDLLALSNIDYGTHAMTLAPISLRSVIDETLSNLKVMIAQKNHRITLHLPEDTPAVLADRSALERILNNIISNAVKYTDPNGHIDICAESAVPDSVTLRVQDNGIGIPKEDLGRIFERFYRVEKSRSRAMGGTGLGLSIAKEMTDRMHGKLTIDSELGVGTTVHLTLRSPHNEGQ